MATLVYSDVDGVDRSLALGMEPVTIGRAPECQIRSADPRVSRMHARFYVDQGTLWIEDLGSSNGIFVGPNRVSRAPVPTGEIILVGSLMIRLLPASGTLPPPMGLHGTLATWLDLERKTRAAVEEERDAFAKRVGELHQTINQMKISPTVPPSTTLPQIQGAVDSEAIRLRDEAVARSAMLEQALKAVQDELEALREVSRRSSKAGIKSGDITGPEMTELVELRDKVSGLERELKDRADWSSNVGVESAKLTAEISKLQGQLDEAQAAVSNSEHAHGELQREAVDLRGQLDVLRRSSSAEIEIAKLEAAKAREGKMVAEASAGVAVAAKLAEADLIISRLEKEVKDLKSAQGGVSPVDARAAQLGEQITALTARAEKAEKDNSSAQIRAQGAERNLSGANSQAAKAETRAAQLENKVADAETKIKTAEDDAAKAKDRIGQLESQLGAGSAPLQAAEQRAAKLTAELGDLTAQLETRKSKLADVEEQLAAATASAKAAEGKAADAKAESEKAAGKLAEADGRAKELQGKLDQLAKADSAIAEATKSREDASAKAVAAEKKVTESERRALDAEQRASAADTMAKAMAKDVAEALRRAADADTRAKSVHRELGDAHKKADDATAKLGENTTTLAAAQAKAADAEARVEAIRTELTGKLDATTKDLTARLEATQRELAAERQGLLQLVDRKTALEREIAEARTQLPVVTKRADDAEGKLVAAEVQIETLQERITDLESGLAVNETASQATRDEAHAQLEAARVKARQLDLDVSRQAETIESLRGKVAELEGLLQKAQDARSMAEAELGTARAQLSDLTRKSEEQAGDADVQRERFEDALARAGEAERKIEGLSAKADTADAAVGRANATQRQLDEAMYKLAQLEADAQIAQSQGAQAAGAAEAAAADKIGAAEARAHEAEQHLATAREEMEEAMGRLKEAERRAAHAADDGGKIKELQTQILALQKEVDAAENVRSFAAETEREIAQFQRDLKESRAKLAQVTLERDKFESELKDARGDEDTTNRSLPQVKDKKAPAYDPEVTAQADISKYEGMIAKSAELQDRVVKLEKEDATLRAQLKDAEQRLRDAIDGADSESTSTGSQKPIALAEHVAVIEEAIDSLRSNMRAASDETAMMDSSPSVTTISDAISSAQEHVERARGAVRALQSALN